VIAISQLSAMSREQFPILLSLSNACVDLSKLSELLNELQSSGERYDAIETDRTRKMLNLDPDTARLVSLPARASASIRVLEIGNRAKVQPNDFLLHQKRSKPLRSFNKCACPHPDRYFLRLFSLLAGLVVPCHETNPANISPPVSSG
jgi:hypothetical protein